MNLSVLHIIWIVLVYEIIVQINPKSKISMGNLKQFSSTYLKPEKGYSDDDLTIFIQKMNHRALIILVGGVGANLLFGILYLKNIFELKDLVLISITCYLCDLICVIFYCPFQSIIMRNRCCVTCRIFNWAHFMTYLPLLFINSFYSLVLFILSTIALIKWEITYFRHPERFWEGSNKSLRCGYCKDKMCKIKKPI
jgi:hypothetical protein